MSDGTVEMVEYQKQIDINQDLPTHVLNIFHGRDMDGWASGNMIKHAFLRTEEFNSFYDGSEMSPIFQYVTAPVEVHDIPYNYEGIRDIINQVVDLKARSPCNCLCIFSDVSPVGSDDELIEYLLTIARVMIFDHHISWIRMLPKYSPMLVYGLFSTIYSGCELVYTALFGKNRQFPPVISFIGRYDVWDRSNYQLWHDVYYAFNIGAYLTMQIRTTDNLKCYNLNSAPYLLNVVFGNIDPSAVIKIGLERREADVATHLILPWFKCTLQVISYIYEPGSTTQVIECEVPNCCCVNGVRGNSVIFEDILGVDGFEDINIGVLLSRNLYDSLYKVSLMTTKDFDVSLLCELLGGGGHAKAAGAENVNVRLEYINGIHYVQFILNF